MMEHAAIFWKNSEFEIVNESFFGRRKRRKFYLETSYFKNLKMNSLAIDKINVIKYILLIVRM